MQTHLSFDGVVSKICEAVEAMEPPPPPTCGEDGGVNLMPSGVGDPIVSSKSIECGLG